MLPIRDELPSLKASFMTWALLLLTIGAYFLWQVPQGSAIVAETALIPCELLSGEPASVEELNLQEPCRTGDAPRFPDKVPAMGLLYSMVLHAGLGHLLLNMWSFWIFGNNVEDAYGHLPFLGLYVVAGVVGSLFHAVANPTSTIPLVGASGAIAGVMGSYAVLYPRARIVSVIPPFIFFSFRVPAVIFLGLWFVGQFLVTGGGVAWLAHVGGFLTGAIAAIIFRNRHRDRLRTLRRSG